MSKRPAVRRVHRLAKQARRLARVAAEVEHHEDADAREIVRSQAAARIQEMLPVGGAPTSARPGLRALLIINSKSGPAHDSLLRVRELVDLLAGHGIAADVRVKLHKSQARREARQAALAGYPLVLAAGGDGTVASVARGLVHTTTVLGIIPLGTYNNIATSLGIPPDVAEACALVAAAPVRAMDVGQVYARGMRRPRVFLEVGAVGIAAPVVMAGQNLEKGRWDAVTKFVPHALEMSPAVFAVRIDGQRAAVRGQSLLAIVANAPRAGAGLVVAPQARLDDGLLDVAVYQDMSRPTLATHFVAVKAGTAGADLRVRTSTARKLVIRCATPLPVVVDSKVVGSTPAHFRVLAGGLLVIAGAGAGLAHPVARSLMAAMKDDRTAAAVSSVDPEPTPVVQAVVSAGRSTAVHLALRSGPVGLALASGLVLAAVPAISRWLARRVR